MGQSMGSWFSIFIAIHRQRFKSGKFVAAFPGDWVSAQYSILNKERSIIINPQRGDWKSSMTPCFGRSTFHGRPSYLPSTHPSNRSFVRPSETATSRPLWVILPQEELPSGPGMDFHSMLINVSRFPSLGHISFEAIRTASRHSGHFLGRWSWLLLSFRSDPWSNLESVLSSG